MHDNASDQDRDAETVMAIAFDKAGVCPIDPHLQPLPASFADEDTDPEHAQHAASVTASTCDAIALFAAAPGRDEFDRRDVWDSDEATHALGEAIRIMVNGITIEGTQLFDEREPMLWGFTNMLHSQLQRLERTIDKIMPDMRDLENEQDGSEVLALQLQMLTDRVRNLTARGEAFEQLRDLAADAYRAVTGELWHPRQGSHTSRTGALNSAAIDARDFRRAREARCTEEHLPPGTIIAFAGGKGIKDGARVWSELDRARDKYSDMVLLHGGSQGAEKIAASWADARGVQQIICRPNWKAHGNAAPFRRNDELLNLLPKGIIAFPGAGITGNLVDKARQLGIPVHRVSA